MQDNNNLLYIYIYINTYANSVSDVVQLKA